jgi:asparagine synthase (glutamine-hydrolysing)
MCGLAGIVNFFGSPIDPDRLAAADRALAHRGPDDRGAWTGMMGSASAGLVHRRLSIIDLSPQAAQPMWDREGRLAVVFNGEIYNYRRLRDELMDRFDFRTQSDTETILAAYAAWGGEAWDHLTGMFALGLLDRSRNHLWLVRDRFGIKPLWYTRSPEELVFASELPALLAMMPNRPAIDRSGLAEYLTLGMTLGRQTILRGVHKLPPGWFLRVDPAGNTESALWYRPLPARAGEPYNDEKGLDRAADHLRSLLTEVVRDHLVADVPVGVLLSGGIDSSIVAAAAARDGGRAVQTFSVGFADQPAYDEAEHAAAVARHLGCEHTSLKLSLSDIHKQLPELLDALDEPFGDSSYLPATMLSQITRKHVTVALSGDGGDELFAGYWRYRGHAAWAKTQKLPYAVRRATRATLGWLPTGRASGWRNRVRQIRKLLDTESADAVVRHLTWARIADFADVADLLRDGGLAESAASGIETVYRRPITDFADRLPDDDPLTPILLADLFTLLPDDMLHKVDRASMRVSLEVRVPLLDHRVVEFALGLPLPYKLRGRAAKRVLTAAFARDLPASVFARPKRGFEVPVAEFLRTAWYAMVWEQLDSQALEDCGVSRETALRLLDEHRTGRHDHSQILFSLLALTWWASRHLGSPAGAPS